MPTGPSSRSSTAPLPISGKTVLLDAQLAVLLIVGSVDTALIGRHKRVRDAYDLHAFATLVALLQQARRVVVTPNVLTEASNLIGQIGEPDRSRLFSGLRTFIESATEHFVRSAKAAADRTFRRLGLTDAGLLGLHQADSVLLTADAKLFYAACERGQTAINFNHLRFPD